MKNFSSEKRVVVGIIGNKGMYGKFLSEYFNLFGVETIGSDLFGCENITASNIDVVERSDVIIFSVPPRETSKIIEELVEFSKSDQLWMDITSMKRVSIPPMLKSSAEVVGLHPMCAAPKNITKDSLKGQTIVVCEERISVWRPWLESFLSFTGARIKKCNPEVHDKYVSIVQGLIHATQILMAATITELDIDVTESMEFTSPVYRIGLSLIGRIHKQNPGLYADIQILNPQVAKVLEVAERQLHDLRVIVEAGDFTKFEEKFVKSRDHFGENNIAEAYDLFERLNNFLVSEKK
jgi:prephenate dehydrogenase